MPKKKSVGFSEVEVSVSSIERDDNGLISQPKVDYDDSIAHSETESGASENPGFTAFWAASRSEPKPATQVEIPPCEK